MGEQVAGSDQGPVRVAGLRGRMFDSVAAILFDFDGTLIQQSIDFDFMRRVVLDIAGGYGVATEPLVTMHVLELIDRATDELMRTDGHRGRAFFQEAHRAVLDIELAAAEDARAFPGVPEMLRHLRRNGFRVGIVTRNCRAAVERVLGRHPMDHDALFARDDVEHLKPDPRHLLAALEVLGVAGEQALMCGDHPMDVLAGRRIGARTVGVLPPGLTSERFAQAVPDLILTQVTDLVSYLGTAR